MDGKTARLFVKDLVRGSSRPDVYNIKKAFDLLNAGAEEFVLRTQSITSSQSITTVADQANYDLEPDFSGLYLKTDDPKGGKYFIRYNDGTTTFIATYMAHQTVYYNNDTTSVSIPPNFTIHDKTSLPSQLTGATTSAGALSGGVATLTDTGESFETTVNPRDIVHDTSNGYSGVVLSVTDDENLITAIFDDNGDPQAWASSSAWVIQPNPLTQIQLVPPPSTASHTVTVPYVVKPNPVYGDFYTWRINEVYHKAFCFYAASFLLSQYQAQGDLQNPDLILSQKYMAEFDKIVGYAQYGINKALGKKGYSMSGKA